MNYIDYYQILGVQKNASQADIKRAYRKLAREYHPDLHPDDPDAKEKFQQINEANEVLGDEVKRRQYDEYGKQQHRADEFRQREYGFTDEFGDFHAGKSAERRKNSRFSDFFEQLFGEYYAAAESAPRRGDDYETVLELSLREAASTHKRIIQVGNQKLRITIPAGVADGQRIRLPRKGGKGYQHGEPGDLYITFKIKDDAYFVREGDNLLINVSVDLYTSLLGGYVMVETLDGQIRLKIEPETGNGKKLRLRGKGFPIYKGDGRKGDLIVMVNVQLPTRLTDRQKERLRQMRDNE